MIHGYYINIWKARWKFYINAWKYGSILPRINGLGWQGDGMTDNFGM